MPNRSGGVPGEQRFEILWQPLRERETSLVGRDIGNR
jgi:hypothetical protein